MGRLPFDPKKMAGAKTPPAGGGAGASPGSADAPITVSALAGLIDEAVRAGVPRSVRVVGEVSNFTDRTHWYFSIKDAEAVVSCVMFQFAHRRAGFVPALGQLVVVSGQCEFYKPQGRLTFRVEKIEPVGTGAMELALKRLIEEVRGLGWLSPERKRPLPAFPRRVAVVTSRTGAALQDVINTVRKRCPAVELCLLDVLVQGADAAPGIARAIDWVSAHADRLGIDTLIVTRGGGSIEDLWAFNDREVARAIVECSVPVAAAIGHETDTTLAELVADERCATPTQAAMRATPDKAAVLEQLDSAGSRLLGALRGGLRAAADSLRGCERHLLSAIRQRPADAGRRLEQLAARLEQHRPAAVYARRRARLDDAERRLSQAVRTRIDPEPVRRLGEELTRAVEAALRAAGERLGAAQRQLELVGPQAVLRRGYSVTLGADGQVLRSASAARAGDALVTRLADGRIESVVKGDARHEPISPASPMPAARSKRKPPKPPRAPEGPGLFG
jgi:exodeoxyribonuclease VII large subunit